MNVICSPFGTFTISTSQEDDVSITESVNLYNVVHDDKITLTCPSGNIHKINTHSPIQTIIENLVTTLATEFQTKKEKYIYDPSLVSVEFKYFYCTEIREPRNYHGILIDTDGNTHPCYIPHSVYKQIPTRFKNKLENSIYNFKFDKFGTIHSNED